MKIYKGIEKFNEAKLPVVSVGTFDGLHIGHQKIISEMTRMAREINGDTVVITFDPHPRLVIHPDSTDLKFINTVERKFRLLEQFGIDHLIVIPFTKEFARTASEEFISQYIVDKIEAKKLIIGYDHQFGKDREGNFDQLSLFGKKYGFEVAEIPAQYIDETPVSSTKIRNALNEGQITKANTMLGYDYSITGKVVEGNKIGRGLGFPTANIDIDDKYKLIAAGGVYACKIEYAGSIYYGMGNIGTRPTIGKNGLVTEVHIFDFDKNLYGEEITIYFIDRIRDEVKFDSLENLRSQLEKDKNTVSNLFS